jgi:predicted Ser/Thr protein kinase
MKKIGRYEIVSELGRGAMGVVYKASDPTIGRLVAIKVLSLDSPAEQGIPGAREIFMREARAAGRLSHPGIVTIHDALEDPESHSNYIVMEFIPGRTLESVLVSEPPPTAERALDVVHQIAEALDYAHRHQIIHRDLKPANILLTEDGRVKITDFGIAKIAAREGAMRTVAIMGTPSYMSPEQVTGGDVDARSDLFSVGILLYLMLVGQKPFAGDTAAVMFKIVYEDPVLPSQVNPELNSGHDYLVLRCLAKDRTKRYANARELLDDLDEVRQGRRPRSEAKFPVSELRAAERTLVARRPFLTPHAVPSAEAQKSRWVIGIVAAVVALAALLRLGIWFLGERRASPPPPTPTRAATATPAPAHVTPAPAGRPAEGATPAAQPPRPVTPPAPSTSAPATAAETAKTLPPPPARPVVERKVVTLECRHELKEATLSVATGDKVFFRTTLLGKKKGGFLGIKGSYAGTFSHSLKLPPGARELTVRVYTADASVNVLNKISAEPPPGASNTLLIVPSRGRLTLNWQQKQATHP